MQSLRVKRWLLVMLKLDIRDSSSLLQNILLLNSNESLVLKINHTMKHPSTTDRMT